MNPQNQIKALAELDGKSKMADAYLECCAYADEQLRHTGPGESPYTREFEHKWDFLRGHVSYLTSYDAIIPLVQKEFVKQKDNKRFFEDFYDFLTDQGRASWMDIYGHVGFVVLPPAQLCEALLRATGLWRE